MFTLSSIALSLLNNGGATVGAVKSSRHLLTTLGNSAALLEMIKTIIPPLLHENHKGVHGRLAVIGGCKEYTGAPYFAAISALKVGADLSHVICTNDACTPIKSYSPEIIVHPILDSPQIDSEVSRWLNKFHALVIGPGLGQDMDLLNNVATVIKKAINLNLPLVIDADGVFLLTKKPDLIQNYERAILTPNAVEFDRLYKAVLGKPMQTDADPDEHVDNVSQLSRAMGHVTIVRKGPNDIISDGRNVLICCGEGSPRRCGGQGDLLSGSMGVFSHWAYKADRQGNDHPFFTSYGPTISAAYAACLLTRECNREAFKKFGRSMTTTDMIGQIHEAFEFLFE